MARSTGQTLDDMVAMFAKLLATLVQQLERFSPTLLTNLRHARLMQLFGQSFIDSSVKFSFF